MNRTNVSLFPSNLIRMMGLRVRNVFTRLKSGEIRGILTGHFPNLLIIEKKTVFRIIGLKFR